MSKKHTKDNKNYTYLDKGTTIARDYCSKFVQVAKPAYGNLEEYFHERPIVCTFVTIFTLLSLVPVVFFICTSLLILITFTFIALSLALLAGSGIVLTLLGLLVLVLIGTFFASIFLSGVTLSTYIFVRLVANIRNEGLSSGAMEWIREIATTFLHYSAEKKHDDSRNGYVAVTTEGRQSGEYSDFNGSAAARPSS